MQNPAICRDYIVKRATIKIQNSFNMEHNFPTLPAEIKEIPETINDNTSSEIISSTVIVVAEGEMNVTGSQFAEWYLRKFAQEAQR